MAGAPGAKARRTPSTYATEPWSRWGLKGAKVWVKDCENEWDRGRVSDQSRMNEWMISFRNLEYMRMKKMWEELVLALTPTSIPMSMPIGRPTKTKDLFGPYWKIQMDEQKSSAENHAYILHFLSSFWSRLPFPYVLFCSFVLRSPFNYPYPNTHWRIFLGCFRHRRTNIGIPSAAKVLDFGV